VRQISEVHANEELNRVNPRKSPVILKEVVKVSPYIESKWTSNKNAESVEDSWPVRSGEML